MTRAAFNTTCDLYSGPGTGTPGALIGTFDCRLVSDAAILLVGANAPTRLYYLTIQDATPVGVWSAPSLSVDAGLADRVAVPSGTDARFMVLFTEQIDWHGQPVYQRANLVEIIDSTPIINAGLIVGEVGEAIDAGLIVGEVGEAIDAGLTVGPLEDDLDAGLTVGDLAEDLDAVLTVGDLAEDLDAGLTVGDLAEDLDAGLTVGGDTRGEPGATCEDALELELGESFDGLTSSSALQWFRVFVPSGTTVFLHLDSAGAGWNPGSVRLGTSCEDAFERQTQFSAGACWSDTPSVDSYVYYVVAVTTSPVAYSFTCGEGSC